MQPIAPQLPDLTELMSTLSLDSSRVLQNDEVCDRLMIDGLYAEAEGELDRALDCFQITKRIYLDTNELDKKKLAYTCNCLAVVLVQLGKRQEALQHYIEAFTILSTLGTIIDDSLYYSFLQATRLLWPVSTELLYPSLKDIYGPIVNKLLVHEAYFGYMAAILTELEKKTIILDADFFLALKIYLYYSDSHRLQYNLEQVRECLLYAHQIYDQWELVPRDHPDKALCYAKRGEICKDYGRIQEAKEQFEKALQMQLRLAPSCNLERELADTYNALGDVLCALGNFEKAREYIENALNIRKKLNPEQHPSYIESLNSLGRLFRITGSLTDALQCHQKARIAGGPCVDTLQGIGQVLMEFGLLTQASDQFREMREWVCGKPKVLYRTVIELSQNKSFGESLRGKYHDALTADFYQNLLSAPYLTKANAQFMLGQNLDRMGFYDKALLKYKTAMDIHKMIFRENHYVIANYLEGAGECLAKLGEYDEAQSMLYSALRIRIEHFGPGHLHVANSHDALGRCYILMNDKQKARVHFEKARAIRRNKEVPSLLDLSSSYLESLSTEPLYNPSYKLSETQFSQLIRYAKEYLDTANVNQLTFENNPTGFVRLRLPVPAEFADRIETLRINFWAPRMHIAKVEVPHNHPRYFESMIITGGYTHVCYKEDSDPSKITHTVSRIFKSAQDSRNISPCMTKNLCCLGPQSFSKGAHIAFPQSLIHQVTETIVGTMSINCVMKDEHNRTYYDVFMPICGPQDPEVERIELLENDVQPILQQIKAILTSWINS